MEKTAKLKNNNILMAILKGSLIAVVVSLVGILFFAFIIKMFGITDQFLKPVNQIIKGISILLGVFGGLKAYKEKGLVLGLVIGLVYTLLAFLVFSTLNGNFKFDKSLLTDVLFGGIMGAISGIIAVNLKGKNKKNA